MLKETALIEEHRRCAGKLIAFHGWKLPLEFSGSKAEHLNVRKNVGLFDVSHMGEIRVLGKGALKILEKCLTNKVAALKKNRTQYNLLCNETGGVVDDLILYCLEPGEDYLLCVNAACLEKDLDWIRSHTSSGPEKVRNESSCWAQLALQGPKAPALLVSVLGFNGGEGGELDIKKNHYQWFSFSGQSILVSATGYTGEKGFEILISPEKAPFLWREILEKGKDFGCLPSGLAARDTLRMEMKYPLYGNDLNESIDPHSAGLSWAIKNPTDFIGSAALSNIKEQIRKKWVGFQLSEVAGVPRSGSRILVAGKSVGKVTSGAKSPGLDKMIGLGYVEAEYSTPSQCIQVEIHQNPVPAEIVATPFIKK
jgi:aminomethyltransferase